MNRTSNFELLRLILMLLIVIHHCIVVGLGLEGLSPKYDCEIIAKREDIPLLFLINSFCIVAVNVFILLSGYFGIKVRPQKVLSLLFAIFFYTVLFTTLPLIFQNDIKQGLIKLEPFANQPNYWFMREYFILMLFSPLVNDAIQNYSKRSILLFLSGLIFISCYLGFANGCSVNQNGYNFVNFILLYTIGGYIRRFPIIFSKRIIFGGTYVALSLITAFMCIFCYSRGANGMAWKLTYYNNPLVIMASLALFLFFHSIKLQSIHINNIAKSSLSIYLFGCTTIILQFTSDITKSFYLKHDDQHTWLFVLSLLGISLGTAVLAVIIDQARLFIWNKIGDTITTYIRIVFLTINAKY